VYLLIISDSVAVEIFAIGQPCAKIFRKVRCATFFETRCRVGFSGTADLMDFRFEQIQDGGRRHLR